MSSSFRLSTVRNGFHPTFWVANGMELFERLAYYGQQTILVIYLRDSLGYTAQEVGNLSAMFGGLIYLLPIVAGTIADRLGFRKAFSIAFFILAVGYFMIGFTGMAPMQGALGQPPSFWLMMLMIVFTAIGGSFIKPAVLGTVAITSQPETKSLGFAIYYWIVNIGAALGPVIAFLVRDSIGIQYVYMVSAISCALMLIVNLLFYKEVRDAAHTVQETLADKMRNLVFVLGNFKFMIFLLIFSLYWIVFWQIFILVPFYVNDFISPDAPYEIIMSAGAFGIIVFQLSINWLTRGLSPRTSILIGFGISSLLWLIVAIHPTIWTIVAGILVFSIGEMIQAPRYYEYISTLAPPGQQGLFQGYAFLPIAIARFVGDPIGAYLYSTYAHTSVGPQGVFLMVFGIGVVATILMAIYNAVVSAGERKAQGV